MMEAARIVKALGLKPRRTIRVALWSGEEQGLLGSKAYVAQHFGTAEAPKPEFDTFGGYLNVDSGTGRIRGATVFGPAEAARILREILAPFEDLGVAGATATTSRRTGRHRQHLVQCRRSARASGSLQDPIEYQTYTWHTNLDTYERIVEADVKKSAAVDRLGGLPPRDARGAVAAIREVRDAGARSGLGRSAAAHAGAADDPGGQSEATQPTPALEKATGVARRIHLPPEPLPP